jgi:predicted XRE-type DNA-binding protein
LEDSKGSDFVYKFFLENANETEDNFQKKYEKIMENAKNKQKNTNLKQNKYHTTIDINQGNIQKFNSAKAKRKRLSIFDFSEHAKNLMKNDGLDESLISIINDNNKKSVKRNNLDSIKNSEKNNDAFLKQKDLSFENMKSGVSIFSILENLG